MKKIIWLHGLGANKFDLQPVADQLNLQNVEHIFLQAPNKKITLFNSELVPAWYNITGQEYETGIEDQDGILTSYASIKKIIDNYAQKTAYTDIILAGFSQGGAMSLFTGLKLPQQIAGIIALSCYLPLYKSFTKATNTDIKIFKAAGIEDPTVKFEVSAATEKILSARGYNVCWKVYNMEHKICSQEIIDIKTWLKNELGVM